MYKISPIIRNFLSISMKSWKTTWIINNEKEPITVGNVDISCGIFQGDSLSPLLFCLALIPLSKLLNETSYGYTIYGEVINHLFYMDDLNLYNSRQEDLKRQIRTVHRFSNAIGMEFGLE